MKKNAIASLMVPQSIAVIGASTDPQKTAGKPIFYLQKNQYSGKIFPINPKVETIAGLKCYPDIASLPETPDVAIILVGTEGAIAAVAALAKMKTPVAIVLTSGFAETGPAGLLKQEELLRAAGKMRILGPNTMGMVNITDQITLSPSGALAMDNISKGHVSLVSQSGGVLGALLSRAAARGIGLSKLVATSNEADLNLADFIDYFVDDATTKIILLYIESIRQPEQFREAALRARKAGKPIVVFKVGKSAAGMQAAISHTGAMAGSDRLYDALFAQVGIIRAHQFSDFLDIPIALGTGRTLPAKRVAILTSTGGAGTLVADSLGEKGFELPVPDAITAEKLALLDLGDQAVLGRNPIDVTLAGLQPNILKGAIKALVESDSYDALILILGSSSVSRPELMAEAVKESLQSTNKLILAYVSPHAPQAAEIMTKLGVPTFTQPESCAVAMQSIFQVSQYQIQENQSPQPLPEIDLTTYDHIHRALDEHESKQLFKQFGISTVNEVIVRLDELEKSNFSQFGSQVVIKILSKEIIHKTEVGGVALNVPISHIPEAIKKMQEKVLQISGIKIEEFLVQEQASGGLEFIIGMYRDPLGAAILVGMGGITAELFQDTSLRLLTPQTPLTQQEARAMLQELKIWPLLNGYRGRPAYDVNALTKAIVHFSELILMMKDRLLECEINPIFVFEENQGAQAADGIAILA
jgi:acyl-CoA synthetase (NDP forming)